ncbi:hypothetical protein N8G13_01855 [Mycoplasma zalophi]|uniref:P68 family surface lipoprotein n=1 Tax=Mycoplasma zalophi TaxID=191287 RepID=UPI0021C72CB6|nr:hypothetical protein [Mycoplasma zalophi]MCU4117200.1 hypothetical protein [Mycoplasma zalophi]
MTKSKKILFLFASLGASISLISVPALAAACQANNTGTTKEETKNDNKKETDNDSNYKEDSNNKPETNEGAKSESNDDNQTKKSVIFSAPQGKYWPLMTAIAPIINYYNESKKNEPGFLPVVLQTQEQVKTFSETTLVQNTVKAFNENDAKISNILLGNQIGAYILKSNDKLLELPSEFNVEFNEKIKNIHSTLPGEDINDKSKIYSIPFDLSDTDALEFNLDIMHKLFEIIKEAGGTVSGSIYDASVKASKEGNSIPQRSPFYAIKAKTNNQLNGMNVTDETFKTFAGVREFINKIYENTEFDQTKMANVTKNARLLSIDYQGDVFLKELVSKTQSNDKLWNLKTKNDPVEKSVISYENLLNNNSEQVKNFVSLWNEYKQSIKHKEIKAKATTEGSPINFQTIQFKTNDNVDWGGFDLMRYEAAITYGAAVGDARNKQSMMSVLYHLPTIKNDDPDKETKLAQNKAEYDLWTKDEDMLYLPSIDKYSTDSKQVFWEGGSSLLAVKTNDQETNNAAIKFLNFLFNGESPSADGTMVENWIFIAENSGYIVPTKAILTQEKLAKIKEHQKQLRTKFEQRAQELGENGKNFLVRDEQRDKLSTAVYNLNSAILSLESLLKFATGEAHDTNYVGDSKSVKLIAEISSQLLELSKLDNENNPLSTTDGATILKKLQDLENKE